MTEIKRYKSPIRIRIVSSLPLLRRSVIRPVLPDPLSFHRTMEPPQTGYRGLQEPVTEDCFTYSWLGPGTGQVYKTG